jgi:essential nuclear protein 1
LQYIDPKTSERLLSTARLQKNKYERADYDSGDSDADDGDFEKKQKTKRNRKSRISISDIPTNDLLGDDDDGNSSPDAFSDSEEPPVVVRNNDYIFTKLYKLQHIDPHEEKLLAQFITARPSERKTLAELIQAKIDEKQSKQDAESVISGELERKSLNNFPKKSEGHTTRIRKIHPKVVEMFHGVREVLSKYRSGKLPKAFKIIPKLINWEQVRAHQEFNLKTNFFLRFSPSPNRTNGRRPLCIKRRVYSPAI